MWSYSRVDTVRPKYLERFKKAGINWLALGVEAGNQNVRREVSKGSFEDVNIRDVVRIVRDSGIDVYKRQDSNTPTPWLCSVVTAVRCRRNWVLP